jgi:hypothetical protein
MTSTERHPALAGRSSRGLWSNGAEGVKRDLQSRAAGVTAAALNVGHTRRFQGAFGHAKK